MEIYIVQPGDTVNDIAAVPFQEKICDQMSGMDLIGQQISAAVDYRDTDFRKHFVLYTVFTQIQ